MPTLFQCSIALCTSPDTFRHQCYGSLCTQEEKCLKTHHQISLLSSWEVEGNSEGSHRISPNHTLILSKGTGCSCHSLLLPRGGNRQFVFASAIRNPNIHQSVTHIVTPLGIARVELLEWKREREECCNKSEKGHLQNNNDIDLKSKSKTAICKEQSISREKWGTLSIER